LYRRLPKFVGSPQKGHTKTEYELIKMSMLNEMHAGSTVDYSALMEKGVATKENKGREIYKVMGGEQCKVQGLTVRAHAFTSSAKEAIEAAGGKCIVLSPTRHIPIEEALADQAKSTRKTLSSSRPCEPSRPRPGQRRSFLFKSEGKARHTPDSFSHFRFGTLKKNPI